jgi:hypothetical protein
MNIKDFKSSEELLVTYILSNFYKDISKTDKKECYYVSYRILFLNNKNKTSTSINKQYIPELNR